MLLITLLWFGEGYFNTYVNLFVLSLVNEVFVSVV